MTIFFFNYHNKYEVVYIKKIKLNFLTDTIPLIFIMIIGIFKTKIFLEYLGTELVGLYQLYSQLIGYLTLVESGMSSILLYKLFKPIKENDYNKINILISTANIIFKIIGIMIIIIGFIVSFIIPNLIKNNPFNLNYIILTFMLYIITNAIYYFIVSYKILLDVEEKKHICNLIIQLSLLIQSILEIIVVTMGYKLITVLLVGVIVNLISSLIIMYICKKNNKFLNLKVKKDYSMIKDTKNVIVEKITNLVSNNIDLLLISYYMGLTYVVIYSTYNYIFNSIKKFINKIYVSVIPSMGKIYLENKEKFINIFKEFNNMVFMISNIIVIPLFIVINSFINIWYKNEVNTNIFIALLFSLNLFYLIIRQPIQLVVEVLGLFKISKKSSLITLMINLILSIILIRYLNIIGVLLATFISYIIGEYLIKPKLIFKEINMKIDYYKSNMILIFIFLIMMILEYIIFSKIKIISIFIWFIYSLIIFIINLIITLIIYHIIKKDNFIKRIRGDIC